MNNSDNEEGEKSKLKAIVFIILINVILFCFVSSIVVVTVGYGYCSFCLYATVIESILRVTILAVKCTSMNSDVHATEAI